MALAWCFERNKPDEGLLADRVLEELADCQTWVPVLWHTEIANALLVGERRKVVTEAQVLDFLSRLTALPIDTDDVLVSRRCEFVMALGREHQLTAYDATYLELALRRGARLATFDAKLAGAMRRAGGLVIGDESARG